MALRGILAVSADGLLARGPNDDMSWTGKLDKQLFKLLTCVGGDIGVGTSTWLSMPRQLQGRRLHLLSRDRTVRGAVTLEDFVELYDNTWIASPGLVLAAIQDGLMSQMFMCRVQVKAAGQSDPKQHVLDTITPVLHNDTSWHVITGADFGSVYVEIWQHERN